MVGFLKVTALVFLGVVVLACVSTFLFFQVCSGRMSACYQAWKSPDSMKRERLGALTQFAASATAIAFPVVLDNDEAGLLFADRKTGRSKLIPEKNEFFVSPHLSADGERLVLIQRHVGIARNGRHRYMHWDFYLLKKGSAPVRLSDFRLYALDAISAVNDKLIFTGLGHNPVLPESKPLPPNRSQIYAVELDQQAQTIRKPPGTLAPLFMIGGLSVSASASPDGRRAAVLNTKTDRFYYRYDMVLATIDGSVQRRIDLEGISFSPGVFVGETLLFNELFEDRYDVQLLDLASNALAMIAPRKLWQSLWPIADAATTFDYPLAATLVVGA
jgi:hypothetical protein